jgi:hypothetical protein
VEKGRRKKYLIRNEMGKAKEDRVWPLLFCLFGIKHALSVEPSSQGLTEFSD